MLHLILTAHGGWSAVFCHLYFKATSYLGKNMQWCFHTVGNIFLYSVFHLTVSGSDSWDHFSVPSDFLPAWPWAVMPKNYFLDRPLTFFPGDVNHYFLPPILSSSGCSAGPTNPYSFHSCFPGFCPKLTIQMAPLPEAFSSHPLTLYYLWCHSTHIKTTSSNSLLWFYKAI